MVDAGNKGQKIKPIVADYEVKSLLHNHGAYVDNIFLKVQHSIDQ